MNPSRSNHLDEHRLVKCLQCGAPIWDYRTPNGKHVALDDAPGPYVIIDSKAYRAEDGCGSYRGHWDHCKIAAHFNCEVSADDFLWL